MDAVGVGCGEASAEEVGEGELAVGAGHGAADVVAAVDAAEESGGVVVEGGRVEGGVGAGVVILGGGWSGQEVGEGGVEGGGEPADDGDGEAGGVGAALDAADGLAVDAGGLAVADSPPM